MYRDMGLAAAQLSSYTSPVTIVEVLLLLLLLRLLLLLLLLLLRRLATMTSATTIFRLTFWIVRYVRGSANAGDSRPGRALPEALSLPLSPSLSLPLSLSLSLSLSVSLPPLSVSFPPSLPFPLSQEPQIAGGGRPVAKFEMNFLRLSGNEQRWAPTSGSAADCHLSSGGQVAGTREESWWFQGNWHSRILLIFVVKYPQDSIAVKNLSLCHGKTLSKLCNSNVQSSWQFEPWTWTWTTCQCNIY